MVDMIRHKNISHRSAPAPWSYQKGSTLLHRLPAGFKLAFLLLLSLAVFIPGSEYQEFFIPACSVPILIILSFIAKKNPLSLLRGSGPLFFIVLAVFLVRGLELSPPGINREGLKETIIFCARIGIAFSAGSLLFSVTTAWEIQKSLSRLEVFLNLQKLRLGLSISLMLGFLPGFFVIWENVNLAWESRAGKKNISRLVKIIPIIVEKMMIQALETAAAMEARGAQE